MTQQTKCWWTCNGCGHAVWRGVVSGPDRPCPKCGGEKMEPSGGFHYRTAMRFLGRLEASAGKPKA